MGLWLLAFVILLLTWAGGFVATHMGFPIPLGWQIAITALVVLVVVTVLVVRRLRAAARAKGLQRELLKQSAAQRVDVLPDQRVTHDGLRKQFEQGISTLKASKLGKSTGAQALYSLPWYVIVGPPGAGKTTALRHSGLDFPTAGGGLRGAGGTRNCDWWFSNDAILIDTAGRWAVHSTDHDEWIAFLALLRRFRSKEPLNGLIVAVAVDQLLQSNEEQIHDIAKKLRSRIDEVITELRMVLPVYLMLTKTDLIGGFTEFFGELRLSERQQIFGATFNLQDNTSARDRVVGEFDQLMQAVERRRVQRIGGERHPVAKQKIYQFPLELAALRDPLVQLVDVLFQRNPFQENPTFRGFYLTSGTQEGRPIDRVISGMASAFGLRSSVLAEPVREPKSYFVCDVFRRVVFPDRNVASRTAGELRRQQLLRLGIAVAALLGAILILLPGAVSFAANRKLIHSVQQNVDRVKELKWRDTEPLDGKLVKLGGIRDDIVRLQTWREDGSPAHMSWGMYTGDTLEPAVVESYADAMRAGFAGPTQDRLEQRLRTLTKNDTIPLAKYSTAYDLLKLYLMTSMREKLEPEWAGPQLEANWKAAYESRGVGSTPLVSEHVRFYLDLLQRGRIKPWEADEELVQQVRAVLSNVPVLDRNFELMIKPANEQNVPIAHEDIFYGSVAPFVRSKRSKKIPGAYTRRGWSVVKRQLDELEKTLEAEAWVLGTRAGHTREDVEARIAALRTKYFEAYLDAWQTFLMELEVERPVTARRALRQLKALTEPRYPYERLLASIRERGVLDEIKGADDKKRLLEKVGDVVEKQAKGKAAVAAKAARKLDLSSKQEAELAKLRAFFLPLVDFLGPEETRGDFSSGQERYHAILRRLSTSLEDAVSGSPPLSRRELANELAQARREAEALVDPLDAKTQQLLRPLLLHPLSFSGTDVESKEKPDVSPPIGLEPTGPTPPSSPRVPFAVFDTLPRKPETTLLLAFCCLLLLGSEFARRRHPGINPALACASANGRV